MRIRQTISDDFKVDRPTSLGFKITSFLFQRTSLPQSYFEKLVEISPSIRELDLFADPTMGILSGDLDFVFKLNNLTWLHVSDCPLSLCDQNAKRTSVDQKH